MAAGTRQDNTGVQGTNLETNINPNDYISNALKDANVLNNSLKSNIPILTLGSKVLSMMNSGIGSEFLNKFAEAIKLAYSGEINTKHGKLVVLSIDNETNKNVAYSSVIIALCKANTATYFTVVLEGTGRKPLDAKTYTNELSTFNRNPHQIQRYNETYVTSDVIDAIYHGEIRKHLAAALHPASVKFVQADAMVIPYYNTELDQSVIRPIASAALNSCIVESAKTNTEFLDLNIAESKKQNNAITLKIENSIIPRTVKDTAGKPVRADFSVELVSVDNKVATTSINMQNNKEVVTKAVGFVDAMPELVNVPGTPNFALTLRPHIVVTSLEGALPTTGYALLSLVTSVIMTNDDMWIGVVSPKVNDVYHDYGSLNILTNLESNPDGKGTPIDFKTLNSTELQTMIKRLFTLAPMLSIDVELCGAQTAVTSIFATASASGVSSDEAENIARRKSANEIIAAATWLTSELFPANYNPDEIFINVGIVVPTGKWVDKSGELRDIRDIDLAMLATITNDKQIIEDWAKSNVPYSISGIDSYTTKVRILAHLDINAEISGKAIRCTFTDKFIITLANACKTAGLDSRYEPAVELFNHSSISMMAGYMRHAGISNATGFATPFSNGAMNYQTPWTLGQAVYR
jgi:hypothetical protein